MAKEAAAQRREAKLSWMSHSLRKSLKGLSDEKLVGTFLSQIINEASEVADIKI